MPFKFYSALFQNPHSGWDAQSKVANHIWKQETSAGLCVGIVELLEEQNNTWTMADEWDRLIPKPHGRNSYWQSNNQKKGGERQTKKMEERLENKDTEKDKVLENYFESIILDSTSHVILKALQLQGLMDFEK